MNYRLFILILILVALTLPIQVAEATNVWMPDSDYMSAWNRAINILNARYINNSNVSGYNPGSAFSGGIWVRDQSEWGARLGYYSRTGYTFGQKQANDERAFTQFLDFVGACGEGIGTQELHTADNGTSYDCDENVRIIDQYWQPIIMGGNYYLYYNNTDWLNKHPRNFSNKTYWNITQELYHRLAVVNNTDNMTTAPENFDWGDSSQNSGYTPVVVKKTYDTIGKARAGKFMATFAGLQGDTVNQSYYLQDVNNSISSMQNYYDESNNSYAYNIYLDNSSWTANHSSSKGLVSDMWAILHNITNNETRIRNIINGWTNVRNDSYPNALGFPIINGSMCPAFDNQGGISCTAEIEARGAHQNHGDWPWYNNDALEVMLDRHDQYAWQVYDDTIKTPTYGLAAEAFEYLYLDGTNTPIGAYAPSTNYQATATGFGRNVIEHIAGIQPKEPGFKELYIRPFFRPDWGNFSIGTDLTNNLTINMSYTKNVSIYRYTVNMSSNVPKIYYEFEVPESFNRSVYLMKNGIEMDNFTLKNHTGNGLVIAFTAQASTTPDVWEMGRKEYYQDDFNDIFGLVGHTGGFSYNSSVYTPNQTCECLSFNPNGGGANHFVINATTGINISAKARVILYTATTSKDSYAGAVTTGKSANYDASNQRGYGFLLTGGGTAPNKQMWALNENVAWNASSKGNYNPNNWYTTWVYYDGAQLYYKYWKDGAAEPGWTWWNVADRNDTWAGITVAGNPGTLNGSLDDLEIFYGNDDSNQEAHILNMTNFSGIYTIISTNAIHIPVGLKKVTLSFVAPNVAFSAIDSNGVTYNNLTNNSNFETTADNVSILMNVSYGGSYDWMRLDFGSDTITNLTNVTGNFYHNWSWMPPNDPDYNSTRVYRNGTFIHNTTLNYYNYTAVAHDNTTISLLTDDIYKSTSVTWTNHTSIIPNNAVTITNTSDWASNAGYNVYFDFDCLDLDNDVCVFDTNSTVGTMDKVNGIYWWNNSEVGTYVWLFNVTDGYGSVSSYVANITVISAPFIPPAPINLANITGNFYINQSWQPGAGNITNSYNVSFNNGSWYNGSANMYSNNTLTPHASQNITVLAFNNSAGDLSIESVSMNTTIPNNAPVMNSIGNKNINETESLSFSITGSDADSDSITCSTNATKGTLTDCDYSFTPTYSDAGTYQFAFYYNDSYGGSDDETITITVSNSYYVPPVPTAESVSTCNFCVNFSWTVGVGNNVTEGYNASVNGAWSNGTDTYRNTSLTAHAWHNISVWAYNSTDSTLSSTSLDNNTRVPNNAISISGVSDSYSLNAGNTLNIDAGYADSDSDVGTFARNFSQGSFNTGTGVLSWATGVGDIGTYNWQINVSDGYGSVATKNFTVEIVDTGGSGTDWDWLDGYVKDGDGVVVNGVTVTTSEGVDTTDINGYYSFGYVFVHNDQYWVNVTKTGYNVNNTKITFTSDHWIHNGTITAIPNPTAPNITSWGNDNTSNETLSFTVPKYTNITFNITANQSVTTTWTGTASPTKINGTGSTDSYAYKNFTSTGTFTVIASCSNDNGSCTNSKTWTITVAGIGGITVSGYTQNALGLMVENTKINISDLFDFTDVNGYYSIENVDEGTYRITARAIGYRNTTNTTAITGDTTVNFSLQERVTGTVSTPGFGLILTLSILITNIIYIRYKRGLHGK